MRSLRETLAIAMFALWPLIGKADYSSCESCHGTAVSTCNGCHAHGTHSSVAMDDINVAGTIDADSYAPSQSVKVTVTGGWQSGWVRVLLLDQNLNELARSSCPGGRGGCTTSAFPVTLTVHAPSSPGTYNWAVAWYGNATDKANASFGAGTSSTLKVGYFTPDANNPNHGYQVVALPAFTVVSQGSGSNESDTSQGGGCGSAGSLGSPVLLIFLLFLGTRLRRTGSTTPSAAGSSSGEATRITLAAPSLLVSRSQIVP